MKKLYICFSLFILQSAFPCSAQWVTGGTQVSFSSDEHHRPFLSAATNGGFYITWQATDTTANQFSKIRTAAYDSNGNVLSGWTSGGILANPTGDDYASQIITSEDDGAIVAWYGYPSGNPRSSIFVQKYSYAGVALWNSGNPVQVSTGGSGYNHKYPIIVNDKHNGVFLAWNRFDSNVSASSPDIILQHIDSTGHVASGWNVNGTGVAITPGLREYYPQLTLTPDQKSVYVVYSSGLIGATSLILNKFKASDGTLAAGWGAGGVTLSGGPNVYPSINHDLWLYSDNANNAVVFWIESRVSANGECYVQQVSPTGTQLLVSNGELIAGNNANGIDYLEVKQEADMNFLVAYNNLNTFNDVATMKVKPDASIIWSDASNTTGGYSAYPYPASDGNKGMYVFYVNTQTSNNLLYALALDSTGTMYATWTVPGVAFGVAGDYDGFNPNYDVNAIGTNKGEAVVSWNKIAGGFYNVFTCNIHPDKSRCSSPTGIDEISTIKDGYLLYPNPSTNKLMLSGTYEGTKEISIYNMLGQTVNSSLHEGLQATVDITSLTNGVYFLSVNEIKTGKKTIMKFIKN